MTPGRLTARLIVRRPGPRTTVQDLGRPGHAALGVGRSGAADQGAFALGNRLLGNDPAAACLETTLGALVVTLTRPRWLAVTGPPVEVLRDGVPVGHNTAFFAGADSQIAIGVPTRGMRNYLAVRGGIDAYPQLGSRSTDLLGGLGPPVLQAGDEFCVGDLITGEPAGVDAVPVAEPPDNPVLVIDPGPRIDWFGAGAWQILTGSAYVATAESDRIGVRLAGPVLPRTDDAELPSEGLMQGAVQVPQAGTPLVFLADQPTTGGYPVIAVVRRASLDVLAQVRPGTAVRFRPG